MLELTHYNDGKEKWQSHEVSMADKTDFGLEDFDFASIYGYGETYEEALEEFKRAFDEKLKRLKDFEKMLFETEALVPIEVDCFKKEIKRGKEKP